MMDINREPGIDFARSLLGMRVNDDGQCKCPFHEDNNPSMVINAWSAHCFAEGATWNLAELAARVRGCDKKEGFRMLKDYCKTMGFEIPTKKDFKSKPAKPEGGYKPAIREERAKKDKKKRFRWKVPTLVHDTGGKGKKTDLMYIEESEGWNYTTADGTVILRASKFIKPDGKKAVLPYSPAGEGKWCVGILGELRPLYNLVEFGGAKNIIIVEGEKCAVKMQEILAPLNALKGSGGAAYDGRVCSTTWLGGAAGWKKADLSPLDGKRVWLWPDNDKDNKDAHKGLKQFREAAMHIANFLADKVELLTPHDSWSDGYDCYDFFEENSERDYKTLFRLFQTQCARVEPNIRADIKAESAPEETLTNNAHYRILGQNASTMVYLCKETSTMHQNPLQSAKLLAMAPLEWWCEKLHIKISADKLPINASRNQSIQSELVKRTKKLSVFDPNRVRGRGWHWLEINSMKIPVCHTGKRLIVNGQRFGMDALVDRDEIWLAKPEIDWGDPNEPPNDDFAKGVYNGIKTFLFATQTDAMLMLGWMMLAPLCGLLKVRPGMWLLGESQVGKTTFINDFVHCLLGDTLQSLVSGTSEAGLRRQLMHDAIAILIDEYEAQTDGERLTQHEIMRLFRISTNASEQKLVKADPGSSSGVVGTHITSMMGFSSIGMKTMPPSNMSRIAQIEMKRPYGGRPKEYREDSNKVIKWLDSHNSPSRVFLHWVMHNQQKLLAAAEFGKMAALAQGINDRDANVTATLLAQQVVIREGRIPTSLDMEEIFTQAKQDNKILATALSRDYQILIEHLRGLQVDVRAFLASAKVPTNFTVGRKGFKVPSVSLGSMIAKGNGEDVELMQDMTQNEAVEMLTHYGIKIYDPTRGEAGGTCPAAGRIWIARSHKMLIKSLKKTQFEEIDYSRVLMSAPNARRVDSKRFAGNVCRSVEISLSDFMQGDVDG